MHERVGGWEGGGRSEEKLAAKRVCQASKAEGCKPPRQPTSESMYICWEIDISNDLSENLLGD